MLTKASIQIYRGVSIVFVLAPLFIHLAFNFSMLAMLLYLPLVSISVAIIARYIDYKLICLLHTQERQNQLTDIIVNVTPTINKNYSQIAA